MGEQVSGADTVSDGWLAIYLAVIPITALIITVLLGVIALIIWLIGLCARAVWRAAYASHPITHQEEID